jgi:hypothetical protein
MADDDETTEQETEGTEGGDGGAGESGEQQQPQAKEENWRQRSRSWERKAKEAEKQRAEYEKRLKDREEQDKSEFEKAVEAARQEGEKTARDASEKERRADRLETAAVRLASKGFKVTDGDGKEVTVTFADPDDAHIHIERMLRRGDLDEGELFDDNGRVRNEALTEALTELIQARPHLAANGAVAGKPRSKVAGSADGGKGSGGAKELEDRTPEEWLTAIQSKR